MEPIPLPTPPPLPPGPIPMRWDWSTEQGLADERHHRLAVLHGACPECDHDLDEESRAAWVASQTYPAPPPWDPRPGDWLTPEGELASWVHGDFRVFDRPAFATWADEHFVSTGRAWAYVVDTESGPWTRALFWFGDRDDKLFMETSSFDRWNHLESVFEHLWPPVFRGFRSLCGVEDLERAGRSEHWPAPPAEASPFSRLTRVP